MSVVVDSMRTPWPRSRGPQRQVGCDATSRSGAVNLVSRLAVDRNERDKGPGTNLVRDRMPATVSPQPNARACQGTWWSTSAATMPVLLQNTSYRPRKNEVFTLSDTASLQVTEVLSCVRLAFTRLPNHHATIEVAYCPRP